MDVFVERCEIKTHRFLPGNSARPDIEMLFLLSELPFCLRTMLLGGATEWLARLSISYYYDVVIRVPVEVVPNSTHPVPFCRGYIYNEFPVFIFVRCFTARTYLIFLRCIRNGSANRPVSANNVTYISICSNAIIY